MPNVSQDKLLASDETRNETIGDHSSWLLEEIYRTSADSSEHSILVLDSGRTKTIADSEFGQSDIRDSRKNPLDDVNENELAPPRKMSRLGGKSPKKTPKLCTDVKRIPKKVAAQKGSDSCQRADRNRCTDLDGVDSTGMTSQPTYEMSMEALEKTLAAEIIADFQKVSPVVGIDVEAVSTISIVENALHADNATVVSSAANEEILSSVIASPRNGNQTSTSVGSKQSRSSSEQKDVESAPMIAKTSRSKVRRSFWAPLGSTAAGVKTVSNETLAVKENPAPILRSESLLCTVSKERTVDNCLSLKSMQSVSTTPVKVKQSFGASMPSAERTVDKCTSLKSASSVSTALVKVKKRSFWAPTPSTATCFNAAPQETSEQNVKYSLLKASLNSPSQTTDVRSNDPTAPPLRSPPPISRKVALPIFAQSRPPNTAVESDSRCVALTIESCSDDVKSAFTTTINNQLGFKDHILMTQASGKVGTVLVRLPRSAEIPISMCPQLSGQRAALPVGIRPAQNMSSGISTHGNVRARQPSDPLLPYSPVLKATILPFSVTSNNEDRPTCIEIISINSKDNANNVRQDASPSFAINSLSGSGLTQTFLQTSLRNGTKSMGSKISNASPSKGVKISNLVSSETVTVTNNRLLKVENDVEDRLLTVLASPLSPSIKPQSATLRMASTTGGSTTVIVVSPEYSDQSKTADFVSASQPTSASTIIVARSQGLNEKLSSSRAMLAVMASSSAVCTLSSSRSLTAMANIPSSASTFFVNGSPRSGDNKALISSVRSQSTSIVSSTQKPCTSTNSHVRQARSLPTYNPVGIKPFVASSTISSQMSSGPRIPPPRPSLSTTVRLPTSRFANNPDSFTEYIQGLIAQQEVTNPGAKIRIRLPPGMAIPQQLAGGLRMAMNVNRFPAPTTNRFLTPSDKVAAAIRPSVQQSTSVASVRSSVGQLLGLAVSSPAWSSGAVPPVFMAIKPELQSKPSHEVLEHVEGVRGYGKILQLDGTIDSNSDDENGETMNVENDRIRPSEDSCHREPVASTLSNPVDTGAAQCETWTRILASEADRLAPPPMR